jgi:hypothetical protein
MTRMRRSRRSRATHRSDHAPGGALDPSPDRLLTTALDRYDTTNKLFFAPGE